MTNNIVPDKVAQLFDSWADAGRDLSMAAGHWPMVSQILERMNLKPGLHCLDVGCGNGYAVRAMAFAVRPEGQVIGVDVSPQMIEKAKTIKSEVTNAQYAVSAAEQLPVATESQDRLLSVEALYYMADMNQALQEWHRVLKPGGSLWVMVDFYLENSYSHCWADLVGIPMSLKSEAEYQVSFEEAGFVNVSTDRIYNVIPLTDVERQSFKPGWGYETLHHVIDFRTQVGSLLISGQKPYID